MKKIAIPAILAAASSVLAWDEYGALGAKKLEIDAMINYYSLLGTYDEDGKKQDLPSGVSGSAIAPVLGVKYGIIDGLDVELAVPYSSVTAEAGDEKETSSGLAQPNIAVKYTHASGFGGFVAVDLPFASEEISEDPATSLYFALQYTKTFGKLALNDYILYNTTLEVEKYKPADELWVYVKPQYNVTDKIGPYLGVMYTTTIGKEKYDGEDMEGDGSNLLTVVPGVNFIVSDAIGIEANVPVSVMGKASDAGVGVYAGFYYTIGL